MELLFSCLKVVTVDLNATVRFMFRGASLLLCAASPLLISYSSKALKCNTPRGLTLQRCKRECEITGNRQQKTHFVNTLQN